VADVILTTMKPRLKNVTAEDVLNSLYYFHVDSPSDVFLMEDMQVSETSKPTLKQSAAPIARKPLPEGSVTEVLTGLPQLPERGQKTETTLPRAPSGALGFQTVLQPPLPPRPYPEVLNQKPPLRPSPDINNIPMRRPLGPRPRSYLSQPEVNRRPLPGSENTPIRSDVQQRPPVAGTFINDPLAQVYSSIEALHEIKASGDSSFCSSFGKATTKEAFSITIIRRDPTSGTQWNVGKISNQSMLEDRALLSAASSMPDRPWSSISVQLTTLGYGQFRTPLTTHDNGVGSPNGIKSQNPQDIHYSFDRQVRMVWSKSWERKYKQHRRASSDQTGAWKGAGVRSHREIPSGQFRSEDAESGSIDLIRHAVRSSGFLSPWNGRCEFSTSTSGRSLKCKHTLNNPTTLSTPTASFSGISVDVSELRFNLPSSSATDASTSIAAPRRPATFYTSTYPSNDNCALSKPPATSYAVLYPSDNDDEDDEPDDVLDLSLGREKAGGGIRGKRAKLGKLIVHDEGLKMLDLVVAANMGIWWTVWER
jgi:hypothetical protein